MESTMMDRQPTQQEIAQRAYAMWEREGRPHGRSLDHWFAAERELSLSQPTTSMPLLSDAAPKPTHRASSTRRKVATPEAATPKTKPRPRAEKPAAKDLH
jgi:hypothetical protein